MSLKDHLEHLVMRLGSRASTPQSWTEEVSISSSVTKDVTDYVLPSDGYVIANFRCRAGIQSGLENRHQDNRFAVLAVLVNPFSTDSEFNSTVYIYGKKGDTVRLRLKSQDNLGWLTFIPSEGAWY